MRTVEVSIKSVKDDYRFHMALVDTVIVYNKDDKERPPFKIRLRYRCFLFLKWIVGIDIVLNPYKFTKEDLK